MRRTFYAAALVAAVSFGTGCSNEPGTAINGDAPVVLSLSPASGATDVDSAGPVVIVFNHPMMQGMELLVDLHRGSVTGEVVVTHASWSADHRTLTITPAAPLEAHMTYAVHLAPALRDANGTPLNHDSCIPLGGQHVTSGMMGGGMHGGGPGPGMMGNGWQAVNGSYGMVFAFTTR